MNLASSEGCLLALLYYLSQYNFVVTKLFFAGFSVCSHRVLTATIDLIADQWGWKEQDRPTCGTYDRWPFTADVIRVSLNIESRLGPSSSLGAAGRMCRYKETHTRVGHGQGEND